MKRNNIVAVQLSLSADYSALNDPNTPTKKQKT